MPKKWQRWTEERVRAELAPLLSEYERMPTHAEMRSRGLHTLSRAITRFGGSERWAAELGTDLKLRRRRWDDQAIATALRGHAGELGRMPTANELRSEGANDLACRVAWGRGFRWWADHLGLPRKGTETHWGQRWEYREKRWYESLGAAVEKMPTRHPFDLLVNGYRVDVKAARRSQHGFAFAGLKRGAACDWFHLVCVGPADAVRARYMVPADAARVHTVTISPTCLAGFGKYARFLDAVEPLLLGAA